MFLWVLSFLSSCKTCFFPLSSLPLLPHAFLEDDEKGNSTASADHNNGSLVIFLPPRHTTFSLHLLLAQQKAAGSHIILANKAHANKGVQTPNHYWERRVNVWGGRRQTSVGKIQEISAGGKFRRKTLGKWWKLLLMDWWKKVGWINQRGAEEVKKGWHNGEWRNGNTATEGKNGKRSHGSEKRKEWKKEVQKETNKLNRKT